MKAALYARVSCERQAEKDLSISAQLKALRREAIAKGHEVVREFIDEAESARTADRPAFQEMISLAKQKPKPFDVILVWKLSRFARNREDSIVYKSLLRKRGIQVVSINERFDDSPAGSLLEGMIEAIDEFYSANLAQDTKRGMRESVSKGYYTAGTPPIGYQVKTVGSGNLAKRFLEIDDNFAPIVRRIFEMAALGLGAKEIAKNLNGEGIKTNRGKLWSKGILLYLLRNEVYTGTIVWGKSDPDSTPLRIEKNHPAIIELEEFKEVQSRIEQRSPANCRPRSLTSNYLLSGILFCGKCGYSLQGGTAKSGRFRYYACHNSIRKGKEVCDARMVNSSRIESMVVEQLKAKVLTEDILTKLLRLTNEAIERAQHSEGEQVDHLQLEIDKQQRRLDNLYRAIESGRLDIDDLALRIKELRTMIDDLRTRKQEFTCKLKTPFESISKAELRAEVSDLRWLLDQGSFFERKTFIKSFVKRITVDGKRVSIEYTYPFNSSDRGSHSGGSGGGVLSSAQKSSPRRT